MPIPILEAKQIQWSYLEHQPILEHIDFTLFPGDYVGLIGPNGSGKTTFLRLLLGLLPLQGGTVKLFGQPLGVFRDWNKIGYIPQTVFRNDRNFPATVREVINSGFPKSGTVFSRYHHSEREAFERVVGIAGIGHLLGRQIGELSGGEMQRIFIARALVASPELLILDEPTSEIDLVGEETFYTLLRELNERHGLTILLVSHDLEALAHNAKSALCLNRQVVYSGPAEGLHNKHVIESVFGPKSWHPIESHPSV